MLLDVLTSGVFEYDWATCEWKTCQRDSLAIKWSNTDIDTTRHVRKIRSSRLWSCEKCFMWDPATLACSLAPPLHIPTKLSPLRHSVLAGQPFAMELPLASPTRCELSAVIHFLSAKCITPHSHSLSVMWSLWATVYGRQKHAEVDQRVYVRTYRHPWWTEFWSAFSFSLNNCKSGARTRNAWRSACDSSWAVRMGPWSQ